MATASARVRSLTRRDERHPQVKRLQKQNTSGPQSGASAARLRGFRRFRPAAFHGAATATGLQAGGPARARIPRRALAGTAAYSMSRAGHGPAAFDRIRPAHETMVVLGVGDHRNREPADTISPPPQAVTPVSRYLSRSTFPIYRRFTISAKINGRPLPQFHNAAAPQACSGQMPFGIGFQQRHGGLHL